MSAESTEASVKHCYSTWSETYYDDYYGDRAPYPAVHSALLKRVILESGAKNVLDAGCGPASFLRELADQNLQLYGFDLTPEMVAEGRRIVESLGTSADRIWEGSVLSRESFQPPIDGPEHGFDAAVCIGVLPHIPQDQDRTVIDNLRDAVKPGGLIAAEARNQLFSLFTLNRYSYEFILQDLIRPKRLQESANGSGQALADSLEAFQKQFRMDQPPVRRGKEDEPGYDEVLSRTHNPLILRQQFEEAGLRDVNVLFYHYHCLPPMFEQDLPGFFRQQSLAMENPHDWRGYFMASAFIVTGRRA